MPILVPFIAAFLVLVIAIVLGRKLWKRFRPQLQA